mgnify:FL=1|tara:strand:+ start:1311 stop:1859 length:549 start_codon:yes stop_codon:yes gene_type:complete
MAERNPLSGTIQNIDPFAAPPPGHSLTQDNSRWAWGQPPKNVDPEIALEEVVEKLTRPKIKQETLKLLMVGISVEVIVEGVIVQGFQEGAFSLDAGLLMKPALGVLIADMAEEEGIPYRLFEKDDPESEGTMDDETFFRMMKENNPNMFSYIQEAVNAGIRAGSTPQEPEERGFLTPQEETE